MKKLRKLLTAIMMTLAGITMTMAQNPMAQIPNDPDVRIGKLDNGLTYYIRYNNWPEHRAEFYIAQRVGSIQENDDQRGLAHFLEHMAFNGSQHFKGNELLRWCESIGVKFGTDLNAYTSIDQTVYNISNVPTTRESIVDSCLLILYDWADGLLLEEEEIEKERGVIHEEWRLRTSATTRMLEHDLPQLYPGSKYGHRMPIGLMEIIDNFERPFLQNYYEKWYRPDNQAIIVVGDVDVNLVEQKIKNLFSPIVLPENRTLVTTEDVPDNPQPIVVVNKDKEQLSNFVEVMMKRPAFPDSLKGQIPYLVYEYLNNAATSMLNDRLKECAEKPECHFLLASTEYGTYIFSKPKDAFSIYLKPKDGQTDAAVTEAVTEVKRVVSHGFTATEYARYKADYLSSLDKSYSNKDKRYNKQFVTSYVNHYLDNEPIPSIDFTYNAMKELVPNVTLDMVNSQAREFMQLNDTNLVVLNYNIEKDGVAYPTPEGLLNAVSQGRQAPVEAYVDHVKDEPLMTKLPKKGKIKSEKVNTTLGFTELTLSNGATVLLKHTDLKKDQVLLQAKGFGGSARYGADDFANIKAFDDAIEASGLGNFSNTELTKALAGKIAGASLRLSTNRAVINGSSTPKDVETMLQLTHLYFTDINKDQKSFDNWKQNTEIYLKNRLLRPEMVFSDSVNASLVNHNPRFLMITDKDLQNVNYDRILQMAKEQTANAAAFTFTIIGNYDEKTIRPLIEQYIGSLPSKKKVEKTDDVMTYFTGQVRNHFTHKSETPKAIAMMMWYKYGVDYDMENSIKTSMVSQVLQMEYLKKIREDAGAAYTVMANASIERNDFRTIGIVNVSCPMKPEKADTATEIMRQEVREIALHCDADKLQKVKEYMLKDHADQLKTNGYWRTCMDLWHRFGLDFHTDYEKVVNAQTPESISSFAKKMLTDSNNIEVIMMPAE